MKILCATDFSPSSERAIEAAAVLARRFGDTLTLLHVIEPLVQMAPFAGVPEGPSAEAGIKAGVESALADRIDRLNKGGIKAEARVVVGSIHATIMDELRERQPRLIALGTHGRKGLARLFLGSVAAAVIKEALCPVLVTRDGPLPARWPGGGPLRLAVGLDGTSTGEAALGWLASTSPDLATEPTLVRLYWPFQEAMRYGIDEPWLGEEVNPKLAALVARDTRATSLRVLHRAPVTRFSVAHVDAGPMLAQEAASIDADAIVVAIPPARMAAWNSIFPADVLRHARMPVICVPQPPAQGRHSVANFSSVLVATDLSAHANDAITAAYGLVPAGGRVELLHVHVGDADASPLGGSAREALLTELRRLVPVDADARFIITNVSVTEGHSAAVAILQAAERLDVDVIALGSHGRSGWQRALLGSVAEEVSRRSDRPVLITHVRRAAAA